jgi:hypothetical protein
MSNRVKVENKSSKKGSYKEQREDYKKEFARILEELTKVFQSFAAIKNFSASGDLRIPSEELNELRNKVSLLCDEINTSMSINGLSPESYKQLAKNQSRAVNQLERIDLTTNVLRHVEALLHNAVVATLREAARQKAEVRQKHHEADKSQQDDLEQIQQRFGESNTLGNGITSAEAISFNQASQTASQEVQKANEVIMRNQEAGLLKAYQSAARHFFLLKEYLKESKEPAKELVVLAEKYSALAAEVGKECTKELIEPKAYFGKPDFQGELEKYKGKLAVFDEDARKLDKQAEDFKGKIRDARVKFDKQAGFSLEALRGRSNALPPDAKVAGGSLSSRASSQSVEILLQEAQAKYSKRRQEFAERLGPESDTAWVRHAVTLPASNHGRGASLKSMAGSPSFSRSEVSASANSVSYSPSYSRQANQGARSSLSLQLDRAAVLAGKTPITLEASSQRRSAPSSLQSPIGAQGKGAFVSARPPSTSPPQSPEENQPGAMAAVREDVLPAAPPLPVVGQSPQPIVQSIVPAPALLEQNNSFDIPAAPPLPTSIAAENKESKQRDSSAAPGNLVAQLPTSKDKPQKAPAEKVAFLGNSAIKPSGVDAAMVAAMAKVREDIEPNSARSPSLSGDEWG